MFSHAFIYNIIHYGNDICTFNLYGSSSGLNMFSVYSPKLDIWMTYILSINKIVINPEQ